MPHILYTAVSKYAYSSCNGDAASHGVRPSQPVLELYPGGPQSVKGTAGEVTGLLAPTEYRLQRRMTIPERVMLGPEGPVA